MTHFNPSDHPRDDDGRFGPKHHREADGVSLAPGRHFAFTSDDEDPDLDLGPESEPAGNEPEPWPFTPDEGSFPREKESVFAAGKPVTDLGPDTEDNEANRAYEAREAAARPARRGIFSRMFSALESFSTSVDTRHRGEMDELESLARQDRIARAAKRSGD